MRCKMAGHTAFQALPNQYTVTPTPLYLPYLRQPGTSIVNRSVFKTFNIVECAKLEIRVHAVGLTNTPNSAPDQGGCANQFLMAGASYQMYAAARYDTAVPANGLRIDSRWRST